MPVPTLWPWVAVCQSAVRPVRPTALLRGVVEAARAAGAPGVEAYPIDPAGRRVDVGFAYVGLASMFDAVGFRRVLETGARSAGLPRLLVRLDFNASQHSD